MSIITAAEAKALAKPAYPVRVQNQLEEVNKAICEAAKGGISNIDLRLPKNVADEVTKELISLGYQVLFTTEGMEVIFFRVSWN